MNRDIFVVVTIVLFSFCSIVSATTLSNTEKLGSIVGGYIITYDLLEKLSNSQCSYAIKKKYSLAIAIEEVKQYMNKQDIQELYALLKETSFKKDCEENNDIINGFMESGAKDGLDDRTLCGMLISIASNTHQIAKAKWEEAKISLRNEQKTSKMKDNSYLYGKIADGSDYYWTEEKHKKELYRLERTGLKGSKEYKRILKQLKLNKKNHDEWERLVDKQQDIINASSKNDDKLEMKIEVLEELFKVY